MAVAADEHDDAVAQPHVLRGREARRQLRVGAVEHRDRLVLEPALGKLVHEQLDEVVDSRLGVRGRPVRRGVGLEHHRLLQPDEVGLVGRDLAGHRLRPRRDVVRLHLLPAGGDRLHQRGLVRSLEDRLQVGAEEHVARHHRHLGVAAGAMRTAVPG